MKKCFIFLISLLSCYYAQSQVVLTESFDASTFPPTGWSNVLIAAQSSGSSIALSRVTGGTNPTQSPHSGAGELKLNSYDANGGSRALITPAFDLSARGLNTPTVSFWLYRDGNWLSDPDRVEVYVNTSASMTGATLLGTAIRPTSSTPAVGSDGWYQYSYNIPSTYSGTTNYLIFHCISDYGSNMFVDDIEYTTYPPVCSGTPNPGNTIAAANPVCASNGVSLSLQNTTAGSGVSYQWQSSGNGLAFTNISGATNPTYSAPQYVATYYRCIVTCSGNSGISNPVYVTNNNLLTCYCSPGSGDCSYADQIESVSIGTLSNTSGCSSGGYANYMSSVSAPTLNAGSSYSMSVRVGAGGTEYVGVWIDFNANGAFETTEYTYLGTGNGSLITNTISVPSGATPGTVGMRVRVRWNTNFTSSDPCLSYTYGETEDYAVNICNTPVIIHHPGSISACANSNVSFSTSALAASPTYQWQVNTGSSWANITNGGVYSGATTATLNITGVTTSLNNYQYRVLVGTSCGGSATTNTSNAATLTIGALPAITGNPVSTTICSGASTTFIAAATGPSGLTYQWQVNSGSGWSNLTNGGVYSGATSSSLTITGATTALNANQYRLVANGCAQTVTSNAATLTVLSLPTITAGPASRTVCPGGNVSFSGSATGSGITYQWLVNANNGAGFTNITNGGVYSGATTPTLTITGATVGMNGYFYTLVVTGSCTPAVQTGYAQLSVNNNIPVTSQPQNTATCESTTTTISVVSPTVGVTYQWQVNNGSGWSNVTNGAAYSGATTANLGITTPGLGLNGYQYRCILNSPCSAAPVTTNAATLTVNAKPVVTSSPVSVTQCEGINASFTVSATGYNLSYQWQVNTGSGWNNLPLAGYSGQLGTTLNVLAPPVSMNGYQYRCVVTGGCSPVATSGTATLNLYGYPRITSQPSNSTICQGSSTSFTAGTTGTALTYQWQRNTGSGWTNVTNGGVFSGATTATLSLNAPPATMTGNNFRCNIAGTCSPSISTNVTTLTIQTAPTITSQPVDKIVCAGSNTFFILNASAGGGAPLAYQWEVNDGSGFTPLANGAPYSGVTTSRLNITAAPLSIDNYQYRCVVSTPCTPAAISNGVTLTVNTLPAIANHPNDATVCPGTTAAFVVGASASGITYNWQVDTGTGSFFSVPSTTTYSGANSATLMVNASKEMNNYRYRCIITGNCTPTVTSLAGRLIVLKPIDILSHTDAKTMCAGANTRLGVEASGTALRYQWQIKKSDGTYANLLNIPPYSGVNTDSMRITDAPDSIDGHIFRCAVSENVICNQEFYTADIPLAVTAAPSITPDKYNVGFFSSVSFTVTGNGTKYQWQENKMDGSGFRNLVESSTYMGVTSNVLTIQPVSYQMSGYMYRCVIDGVCTAPTFSKPGTLIVDPALAVSNVSEKDNLNMSVFPNPLEGTQLNIRFDKHLKGATQVRVLDKLGKLVYSNVLELNAQHSAVIQLQQLAAGTYMLQVVNETEKINQTVGFTKQ